MKTLAAIVLTAVSSFAQPAISTITPAAGPIAGGEYVHIHGNDLLLVPVPCTPPCALVVKFGGVEVPVISDAADEIVVLTPPHAAGSVDVQVLQATKASVTFANGYRYDDPLSSDSVRFLAPVVISASGALGSNWVSELSITNASSEPLTIGSSAVPPQNSAAVTLANANTGAFFTVPRRIADKVTATLHVRDTTRDADTLGTDIPVVPETQFRPTVVLPHIPTDPRFRTLIRVYGYIPSFGNGLAVIRDDVTGSVLSTQTFVLRSGNAGAPSYAQLPIDLTDRQHVRVDISAQVLGSPALPPIPLWAFAAVTNNSTQQVTTITPSLVPTTSPMVTSLLAGHWAGGGACVDVTNIDTMVTTACSTASFPSPSATANGRFEADGTYATAAGPVPHPTTSAHFSGIVQGNQLDLTVEPDGGIAFTIHVTFGSTEPCPVLCR
jgi:hypothetical protein